MTQENLQQQLEMHRRTLANLETQIAGHGELNAPPAMLNQRVITKEKIAELEAKLNLPVSIHTYLTRTIAEFERYEDTTNIVFPALKPGMGKEKKGARRGEERLRAYFMKYDPSFSPRNPDTIKPNEEAQEEELEAFLLQKNRVALLGDPGAGKSTALRGLFWEYAKRWEKDAVGAVPIFAALNRWQENESLLAFLQREVTELAPKLSDLLKEGQVLLLLDGLNELPGLKRDEKTQAIDDPRSKAIAEVGQEYPKVLCLLSCRVKEFAGGPNWCDLHVLPLRREQVEAIAHSYFEEETEKAAGLIAELYDGKRKKLQTLAEKPFYLKQLLNYFSEREKIPPNPALLLAYSVDLALEEEIKKGLLTEKYGEELKERLGLLAFNMTEAREVSTSLEQAAGWLFHLRDKPVWDIRKRVWVVELEPKIDKNQIEQAEILLKYGEGCGLLVLQGEEVRFVHQLLQEWCCALFLHKQGFSKVWLGRALYGHFEAVWFLWSGLDNCLTEILICTLKDENWRARTSSAWALGQIGDTRSIEPLIFALKDKNSFMRFHAANALGLMDDTKSVEPLILALKDKNSQVRESAAAALGQIRDARAVEPLILSLKDKHDNVRLNSIIALGKIGDKQAVEPLTQFLLYRDNMRYSAAAVLLSLINDKYATEPLMMATGSKNKKVRHLAVEILINISNKQVVESIILTLSDKDFDARCFAARMLGKFGDSNSIIPLINALKDEHSRVRQAAAYALGNIGDSRAVEHLILALKDRYSYVRQAGAYALGLFGDNKAVEHLILLLKDRSNRVRYNAAEALGMIGDAKALPKLEQLALMDHGKNNQVKDVAANAIQNIIQGRKIRFLPTAQPEPF